MHRLCLLKLGHSDERRTVAVSLVAAMAFGLGFLLTQAGPIGFAFAENLTVEAAVNAVRNVDAKGTGHREAVAAVTFLQGRSTSELATILKGMDGANPIATNWFRGVVETIAERAISRKEDLPKTVLEAFLMDTTHGPRGRRLAYELISRADENAETRLIPKLLNDPSVELRYDAVAFETLEAQRLEKVGEKDASRAAFRRAFTAARNPQQIDSLANTLKELGEEPDVPLHMGFITSWKLVGPFENASDTGWDVAYPPEKSIDLSGTYVGKGSAPDKADGPRVKWKDASTTDRFGVLNLADEKALGPVKGAIAYTFTEFLSEGDIAAQIRVGCINASKVWLNGELVMSNHVYHSGMDVDQYVENVKLKKGKNSILVKIAQNEQTEPWAQDWTVQLRVCDAIGTAILSQDRKIPNVSLSPSRATRR